MLRVYVCAGCVCMGRCVRKYMHVCVCGVCVYVWVCSQVDACMCALAGACVRESVCE